MKWHKILKGATYQWKCPSAKFGTKEKVNTLHVFRPSHPFWGNNKLRQRHGGPLHSRKQINNVGEDFIGLLSRSEIEGRLLSGKLSWECHMSLKLAWLSEPIKASIDFGPKHLMYNKINIHSSQSYTNRDCWWYCMNFVYTCIFFQSFNEVESF